MSLRRGIPDLATDKIIAMRGMVQNKLSAEYKGTRPYRQEPVSPREQLYNYAQMTPEMIMSLRQSMGEDVVNEFLGKMEHLRERYFSQQEGS